MAQALAIINLIAQLLPLLIITIKAVEEAIPGQGKGEAKLAAVRSVMESAHALLTVGQKSAIEFEQAWPAIEKTANGLVATLNAVGEFKK